MSLGLSLARNLIVRPKKSSSFTSVSGSKPIAKPIQKCPAFTFNTNMTKKYTIKVQHLGQTRLFSTSSQMQAKPRVSPHKLNVGGIPEEEKFQEIMERQREFLAKHRASEEVESEEPESTFSPEPPAPTASDVPQESVAEKRRQLISRMVAKHVPLDDPVKAVEMFNTLIFAFTKSKQIEEVKEVYLQMDINGITPNKQTFTLLVNAYSKKPHLDDLQNTIDLMSQTVGLDVPTFNALINSFAKVGNVCNAMELFEWMAENNVYPDLSTCNALLATYTSLKEPQGLEFAEHLLTLMKEKRFVLNDASYNHLISCCQSNLARATQFYEASISAAKAGDIPKTPNSARLTAMIRVYGNAKKLKEAYTFVESFMAAYPDYVLTHSNHGALFYLNVKCINIKAAFDDLDVYLKSLEVDGKKRIPTDIVLQVVEVLKTQPAAVFDENSNQLKRWSSDESLKSQEYLNETETIEFSISLLRWREIYIPKK